MVINFDKNGNVIDLMKVVITQEMCKGLYDLIDRMNTSQEGREDDGVGREEEKRLACM